jgi:ATP-dependent DNA ligase
MHAVQRGPRPDGPGPAGPGPASGTVGAAPLPPPPRDSRFGSPLKLSKVHWVKPKLVVEVTYLTWTADNLLRQVSYQAQREDKPAKQVVRPAPHPPR